MIDLDSIAYNSKGLPETKNYKIVIAYSEEFKGVVYYAQNKNTGVLEIPFRILGDSADVLKDLESYQEPEGKVTSLSSVH